MGRLTAALVLTLVTAGAARGGELVVVASQDPTLAPGSVLAGDRRVVLAPDVELTLISGSGKVIALRGPYDAVPGQQGGGNDDGDLVSSLARLIDQREKQRARLAVFRGSTARAAGRPDVWGIDPRRGTRFCLRRDRPPVLWRNGRKPRRTMHLSRLSDHGAGQPVEWPAGRSTAAWPSGIALEDGARYALDAGSAAREFEVRLMPHLATDAHRAVWMAAHGCEAQAGRVLDMLGGR
jgi:hypothetical protein